MTNENNKGLKGLQIFLNHVKAITLIGLLSLTWGCKSSTPETDVASLADAAYSGDIDATKRFLDQGADINEPNKEGISPFNLAVSQEHWELAELLLQYGADTDEELEGKVPVCIALLKGQNDFASLLVENGAQLNKGALLWAVNNNEAEIAKWLLEKGADINFRINEEEDSMLHIAARNADSKLTQWLIDNEIDIDIQNSLGQHALDVTELGPEYSIEKDTSVLGLLGKPVTEDAEVTLKKEEKLEEKLEVAKLLIRHGADISAKSSRGETWLQWSIKNQHKELAQAIIFRGVDVKATNNSGQTALAYALSTQQAEMAGLLIKYGADLNAVDDKGLTALHLAAQEGSYDTADFLIKNGADVNAKTHEGETPLNFATNLVISISHGDKGVSIRTGKVKIAELLIENGADINEPNKLGFSPISEATYYAESRITNLLLEKGAVVDPEMKTRGGMALFQTALWMRDLELADKLIQKGANVNMLTQDGESMIEWAVRQDQRSATEWLILNGADINVSSSEGDALLHWAAKKNYTRIAKALIERGIAVNDTNERGLTPRDNVTAVAMDQLLNEHQGISRASLDQRRYYKEVNEQSTQVGMTTNIEKDKAIESIEVKATPEEIIEAD